MTPVKAIPPEIAEWISYDPLSGLLTRKKVNPKRGYGVAGEIAGCTAYSRTGRKSVVIHFGKFNYGAHRVAWFLMTGQQPPALIDHADGDAANNRWANLRAATMQQNVANTGPRGSGLKGTHFHKKSGRYLARICANGNRMHLGTFETEEAAHAAYVAKARELFGEFARAA